MLPRILINKQWNVFYRNVVNVGTKRYSTSFPGNFKALTDKDVDFFKTVLDENRINQNVDDLKTYNLDWLKSHMGKSKLLLRPKTTSEVSEIMRYCNSEKLAICPQGGNTGLVGGSTPIYDEIILSLSLMNTVLNFDAGTGVLQCQAGCILENLESLVNEENFTVPLDLGAKGSCQIGGNISTNAGGLRFIKYGSLHGNVLGLNVVLPNGDILNCMNTMRKNNTGYHLKNMFIGSEGTLGVITEAAILCYPKSTETSVAFLGCKTFQQVLETASTVRQKMTTTLSSLEMLDYAAADVLKDNLGITVPISKHPFYVLIEISGNDKKFIEHSLLECLNTLMEQKSVEDGTIATDPSHIQAIWSVRERITESLLHEGCGYKYDISLPLPHFYEIVEVMRERLGNKVTRCVGYGHLGDGNIHFNATTREFDPEVLDLIEPFIYQWTSERKGSISAEHGIGYKKPQFMHFNNTENAVGLMRSLKQWMDPNGILNPYKVIPG